MKFRLKLILILSVVFVILVSAIVIGMHLYEQQKLDQIGFEVTRVEIDTIYDSDYWAMFRIYFYLEHDGVEKRVNLRLYRRQEQKYSLIDTRFWDVKPDTEWICMQFYKGENETFQGNLYRLTAQKTERTDEPISSEITVWDGRTSNLSVLPFKQTFGIEVTKVEIAKYSTYEGFRDYMTLRNYTLRFYIFNHEEAQNVTFELYREFYDGHRKSSEVPDSCYLFVEHGDAGYIELKAGALELHEPYLDLRYYRLKAEALPDFSATVWYGKEEEPIPVP